MEKKIKGVNQKAINFIQALLEFEDIKNLELCEDQGVKVSAHTYDVLDIALEKIKSKYKTWELAKEKISFFDITIGIIIHDISKSSIRKNEEELSHSQMMRKNPEYITQQVEEVLKVIEDQTKVKLKEKNRNSIVHIVLSHHGKWGKIQPRSREAKIVYMADMESAKYHRINPVNANDILKLTVQGLSLQEIEQELDCSATVIKDRIKRSKKVLKVYTLTELLEVYKKEGSVPIGDEFFSLRAEETKKLKKLVEEEGFFNLFMKNPLMEYMIDDEIFE
ncbi:MAG: phosphohydrolase [Fusobacteriales bacterium]|nr:MAG: phosphohydrolase [Fusobacteriales bacterium]